MVVVANITHIPNVLLVSNLDITTGAVEIFLMYVFGYILHTYDDDDDNVPL